MTKKAPGYWQRTRRLAWWMLVIWAVLALIVPLAAPTLEAVAIMGIPLGYYAGAQGLLIALVIAAFLFAYRQRRIDGALLYGDKRPPGVSSKQPPARKGGIPGMTGALAMAGDALSGAMLVALGAALVGYGHDGLTWLLGLVAGMGLGGMLLAPHLHRADVRSLAGFMMRRFGRVVAGLALLVIALSIALALAANLKALTAALAVLLPDVAFTREAAVLLATVAFIAAGLRTAPASLTLVQAILYPLFFAALTLPVVIAASGFVPGHFAFGAILQQISAAEFRLLENELADPVTLKLFTRPLTTATMASGVLLTLSLAMGMAAMPYLLRRPILARSHEGARLMPATAMLLFVLAAIALPPLAAQTRLGVLSLAGENIAVPSQKLLDLGAAGLIEACGFPAVSQVVIERACSALPEPVTTLRLDDVTLPRDKALFAAPALAGLPMLATKALAAVVALATLLAAAWLGATLGTEASSLAGERRRLGSALASLSLVTVAAAAALLVLVRVADVMTLLAWALAASAAGLFPVVIAGIWSQRANAFAAATGLLAGVCLTLYYIVATRYFAPAFYETWASLSNAGYGAIADYEAARDALAGATGSALESARAAYADAARAVANWWGLRDVAAGALGAAVALLILIVISLITPRPGSAEAVSVQSRIRGLAARV